MENNNLNWNGQQQYPYESSNTNGQQQYNSTSNVNSFQGQYYMQQQHQMPPAYPIAQQNNPYSQPTSYASQNTGYPNAELQSSMYPTNSSHYNPHYNHAQHSNHPPPPPPPPPPPRPSSTTNQCIKIETSCSSSNSTNLQYSCEACSISFPSSSALQAHTNSHIKCKKCSFTGSRKVVSGHYKSKHGEYVGRGLKSVSIQFPGSRQTQRFKICVGDHPDDINAWIAERKKRFPTRKNILKKQEKRKRSLEEGAIGSYSTNVDASATKRQKAENEEKPKSSISQLIAGYGSSSDEDEEESKREQKATSYNNERVVGPTSGETKPNAENAGDPSSKYRTKACRFFLRNGSCKNGDKCNYIHDLAQHEEYKANAESRKEKQRERDKARNDARRELNLITTGREKSGSRGGGSCRQTLLRKLLQNDIQRERSLSLQLLRYIVDCNYLQEKKEQKR